MKKISLIFIAFFLLFMECSVSASFTPRLIYSRLIGENSSHEFANDVLVGRDGSVYMIGSTNGHLNGEKNHGASDAFLLKYDPKGNLMYTKLIGGEYYDLATDISVSNDGSIYLIGYTGNDFNGQKNPDGHDSFLLKYNSSGDLVYARLISGSSTDYAGSIAIGKDACVYVVGWTQSDLNREGNHGSTDAFLLKYDSNGNLIYTKLIGGEYYDYATGVSVTSDDCVYVIGVADKEVRPADSDSFLLKYDSDGNQISTNIISGYSIDAAFDLSIDNNGSIYVVGLTRSYQLNLEGNNGGRDAFLIKYDSGGNLIYTKLIGGKYGDYAKAVSVRKNSSVYLVGSTRINLNDKKLNNFDAFLLKYDSR
jgi:hypothetical protein